MLSETKLLRSERTDLENIKKTLENKIQMCKQKED